MENLQMIHGIEATVEPNVFDIFNEFTQDASVVNNCQSSAPEPIPAMGSFEGLMEDHAAANFLNQSAMIANQGYLQQEQVAPVETSQCSRPIAGSDYLDAMHGCGFFELGSNIESNNDSLIPDASALDEHAATAEPKPRGRLYPTPCIASSQKPKQQVVEQKTFLAATDEVSYVEFNKKEPKFTKEKPLARPHFVPDIFRSLDPHHHNVDMTTKFSSLAEAREAMRLKAESPMPRDETLPQYEAQKKAIVNELKKLVNSIDNIEDNPKEGQKFVAAKRSDERIELMCWQVLEAAIERQINGPFSARGKAKSTPLPTFADRMTAIMETLAKHKTICKRILDTPTVHGLVDDPSGIAGRTVSNKKLNNKKGVQLKDGKRALQAIGTGVEAPAPRGNSPVPQDVGRRTTPVSRGRAPSTKAAAAAVPDERTSELKQATFVPPEGKASKAISGKAISGKAISKKAIPPSDNVLGPKAATPAANINSAQTSAASSISNNAPNKAVPGSNTNSVEAPSTLRYSTGGNLGLSSTMYPYPNNPMSTFFPAALHMGSFNGTSVNGNAVANPDMGTDMPYGAQNNIARNGSESSPLMDGNAIDNPEFNGGVSQVSHDMLNHGTTMKGSAGRVHDEILRDNYNDAQNQTAMEGTAARFGNEMLPASYEHMYNDAVIDGNHKISRVAHNSPYNGSASRISNAPVTGASSYGVNNSYANNPTAQFNPGISAEMSNTTTGDDENYLSLNLRVGNPTFMPGGIPYNIHSTQGNMEPTHNNNFTSMPYSQTNSGAVMGQHTSYEQPAQFAPAPPARTQTMPPHMPPTIDPLLAQMNHNYLPGVSNPTSYQQDSYAAHPNFQTGGRGNLMPYQRNIGGVMMNDINRFNMAHNSAQSPSYQLNRMYGAAVAGGRKRALQDPEPLYSERSQKRQHR